MKKSVSSPCNDVVVRIVVEDGKTSVSDNKGNNIEIFDFWLSSKLNNVFGGVPFSTKNNKIIFFNCGLNSKKCDNLVKRLLFTAFTVKNRNKLQKIRYRIIMDYFQLGQLC